jgi:arylsulfatase
MEAFAGYLSHTDHHVGRLIDALEDSGDLENTLVIVCSDNGASSEGGTAGSLNDARAWNGAPRTVEEALPILDEIGGPGWHNNYPWGWTVAGNTPFRRWKREVHEGGVADPLIVSWPRGIVESGIRHHYAHAIDILPTILEAIGIDPPPDIDGRSLSATFTDAHAPAVRTVQYYEMFGSRALYQDGWKAVVYHDMQSDLPGIDVVPWELYDVEADPAETRDLAASEPERLRAMIDRWWEEAERNQVLPLDNRAFADFVFDRPSSAPPRATYVYWPGTGMVSEEAAVNTRARDHTISAHIDGDGEGVLLSQGSLLGGWTFFKRGSRLSYVHNYARWRQYRVDADVSLEPGPHRLTFRFVKTAGPGGDGELLVDGAAVARAEFRRVTPIKFSLTGTGLWCGRGGNLAVCDDYEGPFPWTGTLRRVVVEVAGRPHVDAAAEAEVALERQ